MNDTSRDLLHIALERGYLEPEVVKSVAREARTRRVAPERVLLERRILSVRRLERLRSHLRYSLLREADRRYAAIAVEAGVPKRAVKQALTYQKTLFRSERRCVRLGSRLIEQGFVSVESDRRIRSAAKVQKVKREKAKQELDSGTLATPLDEESVLRSNAGAQASPASYAAIEAALARVEAIRSLRDDLSTSEPARLQDAVTPDSAMELENAFQALARRRARVTTSSEGDGPPAPPRPKRKKRSGLAKILGRGAA